jgi:RNA polymerase sigma-70 factor (ECF subfamily)
MEAQDSLRVYVRSLLFHREEEREVMQEVAAVLWRKFEAGMTRESFAR